MADSLPAHRPDHSSVTSSDATPPNHLGTTVPTGLFDGPRDSEKVPDYAPAMMEDPEKQHVMLKNGDEEDMDALIDDLESDCGDVIEEETDGEVTGPKLVAEEFLQTDHNAGLTEEQVLQRRKKFGLNQMKEEKENLYLKFLSYFVGPIQFVMEVGFPPRDFLHCQRRLDTYSFSHRENSLTHMIRCRLPQFWPRVCRNGSTSP